MRAILINDTRSDGHVGCALVVDNSLSECRRVGIQVTSTIPNASDDFVHRVEQEAAAYDLALVNGEGTLHDDRRKALLIVQAAERAKELGKSVVLYNTVWQNNRLLNAFLPNFDRIFCRESLSAQAIDEAGARAQIVPDMIFATRLSEASRQREGTDVIVMDSVYRKVSLRLAWLCVFRGFRFMPMNRPGFERIKKRRVLSALLRLRIGESRFVEGDFIERLSLGRTIVSPRFHGTCLAFMLNKPVISVSSNTHKIEGLYRDMGLDPNLVLRPNQLIRLVSQKEIARLTKPLRDESRRIQAFVSEAGGRISCMFDQIRRL